MRKYQVVLYGLILLAVFVVAVWAAFQDFVEVSLDQTKIENIGILFVTLILVAAVIERAVEVYINNRYEPKEQENAKQANRLAQKLTLYESALEVENSRIIAPGADDSINAAHDAEVTKLRKTIDTIRTDLLAARDIAFENGMPITAMKTAEAAAAATLLGLIAASAGIRVLGQFLPTDANGAITGALAETDMQLQWFRIADVMLTALLLAGGADGIHNLVKGVLGKKKELAEL